MWKYVASKGVMLLKGIWLFSIISICYFHDACGGGGFFVIVVCLIGFAFVFACLFVNG